MGESVVKFHQDQQVTFTDLNDIGNFSRLSLDHVVGDAIEPALKFWGFPVTETGTLEVTVGEGRLYSKGKVFFRNDEGGVVLSLASVVPVVTQKIITVAVWGNQVDTAVEPRTFLVDVETLQTEAEAVATENRRHAEVNLVSGTESANPLPPALDANLLAVAHILMDPGGIVSITKVLANEIVSVSENAADIKALEIWRQLTGQRLDTLASDLATLAGKVKGLVDRRAFNDVSADVARLRDLEGLPADLSASDADHFLDLSKSDTTHPNWLARVEEGIRFPAAQQSIAQILLFNQFEDRVIVHPDGLMLPAYIDAPRISVLGNDDEIAIATFTQQTVNWVQKTRTRIRTRYGRSFEKCTNTRWWQEGTFDPDTNIFRRDGETFQVLGFGDDRNWVRLRQFWQDAKEESYWERLVVNNTVQGAMIAQSFLSSQDGWLTGVNLYFTDVAATGDVHVLLTETTGGAPDITKVLARTQFPVASLELYPKKTEIPIGPVHLAAGRYAVVLVTAGAHTVAVVENNKFAQGSLFTSTDGQWFMGNLTDDLAIELMFAKFDQPRVEVQMQPLSLENGIANIDILAETVVPGGMSLDYEIQVNGVWQRLSPDNPNLLNGLPALLPFRLVFSGTTDNHAGIALGAPSTTTCWRPRSDFDHVSKERTLLTPADEIQVRVLTEWWDNVNHTLACVLFIDGSPTWSVPLTPDVTTQIVLPNLMGVEGRVEHRFSFGSMSGLSPDLQNYKIKISGDTLNVLNTFHVAERVDIAFNPLP